MIGHRLDLRLERVFFKVQGLSMGFHLNQVITQILDCKFAEEELLRVEQVKQFFQESNEQILEGIAPNLDVFSHRRFNFLRVRVKIGKGLPRMAEQIPWI